MNTIKKTFSAAGLAMLCCSMLHLGAIAAPSTRASETGKIVAEFPRGSGAHALGISEGAPDAPPVGPNGLIDDAEGGILILDNVNDRIVRVSPAGGVSTAATIAGASFAQDIVRRGAAVFVLTTKPVLVGEDVGRGKLTPPDSLESSAASQTQAASMFESNGAVLDQDGTGILETSAEPPNTGAWLVSPDVAGRTHSYRIIRHPDEPVKVEVRAQEEGAVPSVLTVFTEPSLLGSVALLGRDLQGRAYLRIEQFAKQLGQGRAKVWLLRYASNGEFDGGFDVPDHTLELVPNRYLTVARDGQIYFLESRRNKTVIRELFPWAPGDFVRRYKQTMAMIGSKQKAARAGNTAAAEHMQEEGASGGRARADILGEAEAFRRVEWVVGTTNYGNQDSACVPAQGKRWLRPGYLEGQQGRTVMGVPYNWGGYMSVDQFLQRLRSNATAGNVCTCRSTNCVNRAAAGVDCSGFVSQVWNLGHHTTNSLMRSARRLPSYKDLKAGDALNKPNSHVRLFVGYSPAANGSIRAYEASTRCGRVCLRDFTTKQFEGYIPLAAPGSM